ncbi:unnamed protein product, partial [Ilex paraguariensis]
MGLPLRSTKKGLPLRSTGSPSILCLNELSSYSLLFSVSGPSSLLFSSQSQLISRRWDFHSDRRKRDFHSDRRKRDFLSL